MDSMNNIPTTDNKLCNERVSKLWFNIFRSDNVFFNIKNILSSIKIVWNVMAKFKYYEK